MRHALLATLFRAVVVFAPVVAASASAAAPATQPTLPVVVEGMLVQDGGDGNVVGEGVFLEINYGTLYVGDVQYEVEIPGELMDKSGLALNGLAQVRAILSTSRELDGHTYYQVSALEAL